MGRGRDKGSKKKSKKPRKEKKSKKGDLKKRSKHYSSSSSSSGDEWVEKSAVSTEKPKEARDDFAFLDALPAYSKKNEDTKSKKEKKNIDDYDPSTCSRELNPYWRDGGKGLPSESEAVRKPAFKRPDDDFDGRSAQKQSSYLSSRNTQNWKRKDETQDKTKHSRPASPPRKEIQIEMNTDGFLTDKEMNSLAAKIVKAEILGNKTLVAELNAKLAKARECKKEANTRSEQVMLSVSDTKGNVRPLVKTENASASRGNKRRADTHSARDGKRDKYFPDDDKYSLNKMFVNEKYESGERDERQFMKAVARHRNPNDNLEDIYEENITTNKSEVGQDEKAKKRAIHEHERLAKTMESCIRCIESSEMKKHLIVSMSSDVYLSVPETKCFTEGHCIISTNQHLPCATMLDEDVWDQISDYRKALTRMFESQEKDIVFFETVKNLHHKPHFALHCIPMPRDVGDTAAIYFKKAISECEMEWSTNKKVIDLKGPDVRRGVPKGLPYFWVHFGMDLGFAHVIEDPQLFPETFATEILGGILDLEPNAWRRPYKDKFDVQLKKTKDFLAMWKQFENYVKR